MGDREDLADTRALRKEVFARELRANAEEEDDGQDGSSIHLVAYNEDLPISTGRLVITNDDFLLDRIATLPAFRNQGIGTGIVEALVGACVQMGGDRQLLHATVASREFFAKIGFSAIGDEFALFGLPHILMEHTGGLRKCGGCGGGCGGCE